VANEAELIGPPRLAGEVMHGPDSSLVARPLGRFRWVTCASPDYLREYGVPPSPEARFIHRGGAADGYRKSLAVANEAELIGPPRLAGEVNARES
jgi:DNA-binding transcriptional LysR family regulator